jgi:hypothetical protein
VGGIMLYLLRRLYIEGRSTWDETHGFVVRAKTEADARRIVTIKGGREEFFNPYGAEGPGAWLDPSETSCVLIDADGPDAIILRDFNAG